MFTKKRTLSILLAVVLCVSMVLSGCVSAPEALYPGTKDKDSITVNLGSEPPKMNSILTTDSVSMNVIRHIMVGLTTLDQKDQPAPGVAKSWKISDDQLVYTFELRDDFKWTNGEKVTAKDFAFTFKTLVTAETAAPYAYLGWTIKNGQAITNGDKKVDELGVKVIDDYKLEITLEQPTPYFLSMLAFGVFAPVNEKAWKEFGDQYATEASKIVTNGPYKMTSWAHESEIVLEKNADYPDNKNIKINKIIMKMIKDTNTALNSFKDGQMDLIGLNADQAKQLKGQDQAIFSYDDGGSWYIEYNLENKVLANKKVRQAMTYALDTESFVKNLIKNDSVAAQQFTPRPIDGNKKKFYEEVGPLFKANDVEKAKKLLDEASKELGIAIKDMELSFLIDEGDTAAKYAAFLQEEWKTKLGLNVKVEPLPFKARLARMQAKDFAMVLGGWGPDYNDPMTYLDMFETGNGNNHTSFTNAKYDELLDKVRVEADRDKRFGYLVELEKLLIEEMPVGPIYFRSRDYTTSSKLEGVVRTAFQDLNLLWASIK